MSDFGRGNWLALLLLVPCLLLAAHDLKVLRTRPPRAAWRFSRLASVVLLLSAWTLPPLFLKPVASGELFPRALQATIVAYLVGACGIGLSSAVLWTRHRYSGLISDLDAMGPVAHRPPVRTGTDSHRA